MEKIVRQNLLYDFYGELLTEHQRSIYEDAIYNDMSLSEISESYGITKQGVHDIIKRCDKALEAYENKLHLMERFDSARVKAEELREKLALIEKGAGRVPEETAECLKRACELTEDMISLLYGP